MMKKFILALATISLLGTLPSCTSKDSKNEDVIAEDGTAEDMAGEAGEENLDESLDSDQGVESATTESAPDMGAEPGAPAVAETATDDQLTIDSFGESTDVSTDTASTEPVPDANAPAGDPMPPMTTEEASTNDLGIEPPAPATGAEDMSTSTASTSESAAPSKDETNLDEPKPVRTLQKMASEPWKMGSKWVNGIYFARPGDSLESISQTIYGDDRTKDLKKINPTYVNRDVKPGDKVYYSSVIRPDDTAQVLTYFEEKNIAAKTYVSKPGDNIRKVSQDLLGYPEAWKEVWAYNSVESKQDIGEGVELRYWEAQAHMGTPSAPMANQATPPPANEQAGVPNNEMPPPMPEDPMAQMAPPSQELPPPPDMNQNMANNELPPPPPPMEPPPPPPSMDMAPPPPPPPQAMNNAVAADETATEQDSTLAMGAIAVAVLGALALIIVRRKRKQREMDQALGETHVG